MSILVKKIIVEFVVKLIKKIMTAFSMFVNFYKKDIRNLR